MSDHEEEENEKLFCADRPKQGRAACKKCKQKCEAGQLRIAKLVPSPYGDGKMKNWHHLSCLFEQFLKQRPTTKRIESPDDIDGFDSLSDEDQGDILKQINDCNKSISEKYGLKITPRKPKTPQKKKEEPASEISLIKPNNSENKDNLFREFRRLVANITNESSYLEKTNLVSKLFTKGVDGSGFKGDIKLWSRLLLPGVVKRIYNLQSKQLIKLFSKIFDTNHELMLEHLEQGDIGETIQVFFEKSTTLKQVKKSKLTLKEVDKFLEELSQLTKEEEQMHLLKKIVSKCTPGDLKVIIRLIKHDLRMNAGAKHILDGVHPNAYVAYQSSRNIDSIIDRCLGNSGSQKVSALKAQISLMTPVLPMLAEACKSVEQAMKKCPNGMYSEIKYDGERVQVHKQGSTFRYFSRSLKPVLPHKVLHFKDFIPKAFPHADDLILDSEILMIDTKTGKPLPFGSLGIHKKSEFENACVCLFIFDCIYYNGEDLTKKPIKYRKSILQEKMIEIPNHIMFSEMQEINEEKELALMITKVLKLGLEGLVLKDVMSVYEPGKRHWLKVKKDYLLDGAMADSADLIVLGAWYGTGKKGGMMSVFLMGCYDPIKQIFLTVTKVHTGHDDKTLERLQTELDMIKISSDSTRIPSWLKCTKTMVPDFVAKDPKSQPVWEITGAEFTQHDVHTADGISIRFPRVTNIRQDKTWENATTLQELHHLFKESKNSIDCSLLMKPSSSSNEKNKHKRQHSVETSPNSKKIKKEPRNMDISNSKTIKKEPSNIDISNSKKIKKEPSNVDVSNSKKIKKESCSMDISNSSTKNKKPEIKIANPIPDYFHGVYLLLEDDVKEKDPECIRYFIAYGGTIVGKNDWKKATHYLHVKDKMRMPNIQCPKSVRHIVPGWIKQSIAKATLQDYRRYTVSLIPEEN